MIKKPAEPSLTDSILAAMKPGTIISYENLCAKIGRKAGVPRALEALAERFIVQPLANDEYVRRSPSEANAAAEAYERVTARLRGITRTKEHGRASEC